MKQPTFVSLILDGWMDGWHLDNESHLRRRLPSRLTIRTSFFLAAGSFGLVWLVPANTRGGGPANGDSSPKTAGRLTGVIVARYPDSGTIGHHLLVNQGPYPLAAHHLGAPPGPTGRSMGVQRDKGPPAASVLIASFDEIHPHLHPHPYPSIPVTMLAFAPSASRSLAIASVFEAIVSCSFPFPFTLALRSCLLMPSSSPSLQTHFPSPRRPAATRFASKTSALK